jgi:hypothetical protein
MTTVAWNGKKLVTDSQVSLGTTANPGPVKKIFEPEEGEYWECYGTKVVAFGISGDGKAIGFMRDRLREGISHRTRFDDIEEVSFGALVITEDGNCYRWQTNKRNGRPQHQDLLQLMPPCTVGSGHAYALGVMWIGKDIETAVKAAIKLDKWSGGDLQIWELPPKPDVKSVRPVAPTAQTQVAETPAA